MTPEQAAAIISQNESLLKQNQQLINMLSGGSTPDVTIPVAKKVSKRELRAGHVTAWYHTLNKSLSPQTAALLRRNIKKRKLWLD